MEPLERLAALEVEVKKISEEIVAIKEQLVATQIATHKPEPIGKYAIEVPMDEDLKDWLFVTDMSTGKSVTYKTKKEAEEAGKIWGMYRIVKIG